MVCAVMLVTFDAGALGTSLPLSVGAAAPVPSHAIVTCALAPQWLGAVSPNCEDEVVVSSPAGPSVRAGKAL